MAESDTQDKPRGVAVTLSNRFLRNFLALPEGITVRAVYQDAFRGAIVIHLEGDMLPEIEDGSYPQPAYLVYHQEPDGRRWFELQLPGQNAQVTC